MTHDKPLLNLIESGTLGLATIVFGIMAGFFWTYSFNVNLALLQVDGETYARVQSLLNVNVRHPMFFSFFFGGGLFSMMALVVNLRQWRTGSFWLIALATVIYIVGVILYTKQVNLPLNYYTESWQPTDLPEDWMETRSRWNDANAVRVVASFVPFTSCVIALMLRTTQRR
ncbi:hypothetical protein BTA51_28245 [Hahella sp. CCB-MM4]|uniref:DUF1772 domain-containing protein n=1 Tax=Hahella sp. (strain CCB-MM4) TaxID=1926491 RepID=UPI000B9B567A|nr:DUF1772 domain-containing protein [Hahella sp. CCB-MM4]OZG70021.1 hypothetical protein BTA51_28245 [Hahella sp. CCB-MM4]